MGSVACEILKGYGQYTVYRQHSLMGKLSVLGISRNELCCYNREEIKKLDNMLSEISLCGRGGRHALIDKPKQLTINAPPAVDEEDKKNELPLNKAIGNIHKYFILIYTSIWFRFECIGWSSSSVTIAKSFKFQQTVEKYSGQRILYVMT